MCGFTLLELLIIIGVIAALSALVISTNTTAKGLAKRISCASNLRQLGLAMHLYASGYDESLPPYINHESLLSVLDPGVTTGGKIPTDSLWPSLLKASLSSYGTRGQVWFCPADPVADQDVYWLQIRHRFTSYEYRTPLVFFFRRRYAGQWADHPLAMLSGRVGWLPPTHFLLFEPDDMSTDDQVELPLYHRDRKNELRMDLSVVSKPVDRP